MNCLSIILINSQGLYYRYKRIKVYNDLYTYLMILRLLIFLSEFEINLRQNMENIEMFWIVCVLVNDYIKLSRQQLCVHWESDVHGWFSLRQFAYARTIGVDSLIVGASYSCDVTIPS